MNSTHVFSDVRSIRVLKAALVALTLWSTVGVAVKAQASRLTCETILAPRSGVSSNLASDETAAQLSAFALRNHMPSKIIEVGPSNRRIKRLMVAVDTTNPAVVADYLKTFNLHQKLGPNAAGTLAFEAERQIEGMDYVYATVRTTGERDSKIGNWRYGKDGDDSSAWWALPNTSQHRELNGTMSVVTAFGHLIGVTKAERENLDYYFAHPEERGPCKSQNCIAWSAGIELGKTSKDGNDETRQPLFNVLGVSRTIAHFEIASRLMHAANDRHVATVAFVRGPEGLKQFIERNDLLPPEPRLPYPAIIPGLGYADDAPIMSAIRKIPDGAKIFVPIAAGASPEGIAALVQQAGAQKKGYTVDMLVNGVSESTIRKGVETTDGKFKVRALFLGGNLRKLNREGHVDVVPGYLSDFTRWVRDPSQEGFHYDAMIVRVAPKDSQGRYSLGANNDMILTILRARPEIKIIAEVNPNIPHTIGENFLTEKDIFAKFESRSDLGGPASVPAGPLERQIAANVAKLVDSGSYLQVGIGAIFSGLGESLKAKGTKDIKIFTEMFGDPQMEMIESGVANSAVAGFGYGSTAFYKKLANNDKVRFVETEFVNSPARVSSFSNFVAVNTALQVNLRGDANATHGPGGTRMSSPGGQVEFMFGASRSHNGSGKAIIAIRSTAQHDQISTINLSNYEGAVTTPHESVQYVVTEYGIAKLVGATDAQRAVRLISIAHPKFRAELIQQALEKKIIRQSDVASIPLQ